MSAHTPGPWKFMQGGTGDFPTWNVRIGTRGFVTLPASAPMEVMDADARLIAAAPALLDELQHAHRLLALALSCMTIKGQSEFARMSEIAGIGTDGATRHHERAAVLAAATGAEHG